MKIMRVSSEWSFAFLGILIASSVCVSGYETYQNYDHQAEESGILDGGGDEEKDNAEQDSQKITTVDSVAVPSRAIATESPSIVDTEDPLQKVLPKVTFDCKDKSEGYHADNRFCEVFHYCKTNGFRFTFICPPKSYFSEKALACDYDENNRKKFCNDDENSLIQHHDQINGTNKDISKEVLVSAGSGNVLEFVNSSGQAEAKQTQTEASNNQLINSTVTKRPDPYLTKRRVPFGTRTKPLENKDANQNKITTKEVTKITVNQTVQTVKAPIEAKNESKFSYNWHNLYENSYPTSTPSQWSPLIGITRPNNEVLNSLSPTILATTPLPVTTSSHRTSQHVVLLEMEPDDIIEPESDINDEDDDLTIGTTTLKPANRPIIRPQAHKKERKAYKSNAYQHKLESDAPRTQEFQTPAQFSMSSDPLALKFFQNDNGNIYNYVRQPHIISQSQSDENIDQSKNQIKSNHFGIPKFSNAPKNIQFPSYIPVEFTQNHFPGPGFFDDKHFFGESLENFRDQSTQNSNHLLEPKPAFTTLSEMVASITRGNSYPVNDVLTAESSKQIVIKPFPNEVRSKSQYQVEPQQNDQEKTGKIANQTTSEVSMVHIPVLVPTGIPKNLLKEKLLTSSHLKPTVIPLTEGGQEIPAYVLEFNEDVKTPLSQKKEEIKNKSIIKRLRNKRQTYSFENPFASHYPSPFSSSSFLPVFSPATSDFDNYFVSSLPFSSNLFEVHTPIGIGSKSMSSSAVKLAEQQNIPRFILPIKSNSDSFSMNPEIDFAPGPFEFNEIDDFNNAQLMDSLKRPSDDFDTVTYRPVSIRKPGFKRPPQRKRIPQIKTKETTFKTTQSVDKIESIAGAYQQSDPVTTSLKSADNHQAQEINPYSQMEAPKNLNQAIKFFDDSSGPFIPLGPSLFDSQSFFNFNPPTNFFGSHHQPLRGMRNPMASALNNDGLNHNANLGFSVNNNNNRGLTTNNNINPIVQQPRFSQQLSLPEFGLPDDLRLPNLEIPNLQSFIPPDNYQQGIQMSHPTNSSGAYKNANGNSVKSESFAPTQLNGSGHSSETLSTAKSQNLYSRPEALSTSKSSWQGILAKYHRLRDSSALNNLDSRDPFDKNNDSKIVDDLTYGTRLRGNPTVSVTKIRSPIITVKSSVSEVSSLNPVITMLEPRQVIHHADNNGSNQESPKNSIEDEKENLFDKPKVNAHTDRELLLKFYNSLNDQKRAKNATTTIAPMTTFWSLRNWKDIEVSESTTTSTTTAVPTEPPTTESFNNLDRIKFFESILTSTEPTTTSNPTTTRVSSPYKKVFSAFQSGSFQSPASSTVKPKLFGIRNKPDFIAYLNSLTTTPQSLDV